MAHGLHHRCFQLGATLFGHTGMGHKTTGGRQNKVDAHFLGGLRCRDRIHAVFTKDHQRAEVTSLDRSRSFRQIQRTNVNSTGNNLGCQLAATTERNVGRHIYAKTLGPEEDGQVVDGARRGAAELHRIAILHSGHKLLGSLVGAGLAVNHQDLRVVGATRDRGHVLDSQVGLALRHGDGVADGKGQDGVAISRTALEILHRGSTAAATLVDDNHVLLQVTTCPDHHHPRVHVGTATGTGMSHNFDCAFSGRDRSRGHRHDAGHRRNADAD